MVSPDKERRDYPAYDLGRVRELAAGEHVIYRSWRVEIDIANLQYTLEDVCQCIASLESSHFQHSEHPGGAGRWQDVYLCRWLVQSNAPDNLYIKLILARSALVVELCSFHRPR